MDVAKLKHFRYSKIKVHKENVPLPLLVAVACCCCGGEGGEGGGGGGGVVW